MLDPNGLDMAPLMGILGTCLSTAILALFKHFSSKIEKQVKEVLETSTANNKATFVILQDRILQECRFHQSRGYIETHDAEMLQNLANQYYAMNGNGYVHAQVGVTLNLPQIPPAELKKDESEIKLPTGV